MTIFIVERSRPTIDGAKAVEAETISEAAGKVLTALMVFAKGEITVRWNSTFTSVSFTYSVDPSQPNREMILTENGPVYG